MVPQSGNGLAVMGRLFSEYLAADNVTLSVVGSTVQPTGTSAPVIWLSTAFKTLMLDVTLPGKKFDVSLFRSRLEMHIETHQFRRSFNLSHCLTSV